MDFETIPDPEMPTPPPVDGKDVMLSAPHHQIVAAGCLLMENHIPRAMGISGEGLSEKEMLRGLLAWIEKTAPTIITWNGRGFDMPVLAARAWKHGLPIPWYYRDKGMRYRYSTTGHMDLMDFLADHGATRVSKAEVYSKMCGMPGKMDGVDGSKVSEMYALGELEKIYAYCFSDVAQLGAVFLRTELIRGSIPLPHYKIFMRRFLEYLGKEPRLTELMTRIDREKLMLGSDGVEPAAAVLPVLPEFALEYCDGVKD
jgi:3'-5' exonuclease